jgi:branched-chain amino acid transport system substrate-binding protein
MAELLRRLAVGAAAICLALASAGCGEEEKPVRVAVLTECIGPLESFKESILAAAQLPFIERGARPRGMGPAAGLERASFGGRPVEMLVGCTNLANLSGLIIEVRRLIESRGADVIVGPVGETGGIVVRRLAARYPNATFVIGASGAQATTLSDPQPNVFRFVADGAQSTAGLAAHAYTDLGWRRAALVMDPEPHSWEQAAGFVAEFCALGGTVVSREPLLSATGSALVSPAGEAADRELGARLSREVDGTMLITTASSPTHFLRAYDRGMATLPRRLLLAGFGFAQPGGLSPRGVDLSAVVLGGDVPLDSERPQWRRHQRAYARAFPQLPPESAHGPVEHPSYMAAEALARALERVDGDLGRGGRRLRAALSRVAFDGPAGPVRLDRNRQAIVSVHLRRIEGRGRRARTVPFRLVKEVDQSFGGAFDGSTPSPSFESPKCRRGPVPAWAAG